MEMLAPPIELKHRWVPLGSVKTQMHSFLPSWQLNLILGLVLPGFRPSGVLGSGVRNKFSMPLLQGQLGVPPMGEVEM